MTKEDIICMARKARMPYFYQTKEIANLDGLVRFAALVASAERSACAKHLDALGCDHCATAIRTRGETK